MEEKVIKFLDKFLLIVYISLSILTPFIFTTQTTELFEVPKMHFVYFAATFLAFATLAKFVLTKKITIPKTLPLLTLLTFLTLYMISTIFSIDKFTSVFGYPTRANGGLLSIISYLIIFATALANLKDQILTLTVTATLAATLVAAWGIPAHFGYDPTCFILTGQLNSDCWQKEFDPTLRIFSTLGQPNWLASYLVLILPLSLFLIANFKKFFPKVLFTISSIIIIWATVLTNSRAGFLGMAVGLLIFLIFLGSKKIRDNLIYLVGIFIALTLITAFFGTALTSRIEEFFIKTPIDNRQSASPAGGLTSETGPTESGQIRLIVWRGAINAAFQKPLLGWGPETFAYSYYLFRPTAHNQTTEWNFFYNKAHNEFLNYLANVGFLGLAAYLAFLVTIILALWRSTNPFAKPTIAAIIAYQTTIFFGFSVVATQTLMLLITATVLGNSKIDFWQPKIPDKFLIKNILSVIVALAFLWVLVFVSRLITADILASHARQATLSASRQAYAKTLATFPTTNPFYLSEFAYDVALQTVTSENLLTQKEIIAEIEASANKSQEASPNNLIIVRKIANAYLLISNLDSKYARNAQELGQKLTTLAPTDPQSFLTLAKIQAATDQKKEANKTLEHALNLKPDYQEAQELLGQLTIEK